jgi:DMSO/TMAO reductase YedYZ molybdopterin-dependent catalytic subunit
MSNLTTHASANAVSRRDFLQRVAGTSAVVAAGLAPDMLLAQDAPKSPADPAGTVPNSAVMAEKFSGMRPHSDRPLTGSVTAEFHHFAATPNDRMFVRNNLLTPDIDASKHRLTVKGQVDREVTFSIDELRKNFSQVRTQAMLECAGSGRTGFNPRPSGTPWPTTGGMGCPVWNGVRLRDVLQAAGVRANGAYVAGQGGDFGVIATVAPVIRSIPMAKAMEQHTLVVLGMNDGPLPKVHGHPLRLLVPGWAGSASTKWLHTLTVLDAPFKGTYMDTSYRIPRNAVKPGEKMPPDALVTEGWPVKSMITHPAPDAAFKLGRPVLVEGRAWVGEGAIDRVDLSFDEGATWQRAAINSGADKYAWRIFSHEFWPRRAGFVTVLARAADDKGNVQPITATWNPLGYYWNSIHRVGFMVEA